MAADQNLFLVYEGGSGEIVEKKSRFIATVRPAASEEEAAAFIAEMKKKYWDARHNCSAFVIGERQEITRCSDDGEPAGTAGRPMLDVLLKEGITNVCVVVTRYFGGVLLGTGGLVRAYQEAVQTGLRGSRILKKQLGQPLEIIVDYTDFGKIQYLLNQNGITVQSTEYGSDVTLRVLVPDGQKSGLETQLIDRTAGAVLLEWGDPVVFGETDGEIIYF